MEPCHAKNISLKFKIGVPIRRSGSSKFGSIKSAVTDQLRSGLRIVKSRKLTYDDLTHYQHIISTLNDTIHLMAQIDERIEAHGGWPMK